MYGVGAHAKNASDEVNTLLAHEAAANSVSASVGSNAVVLSFNAIFSLPLFHYTRYSIMFAKRCPKFMLSG